MAGPVLSMTQVWLGRDVDLYSKLETLGFYQYPFEIN